MRNFPHPMDATSDEIDAESRAHRHYRDGLAEVFGELADLFGNPRSHGLIFGVLFASPDPLSMDEIADLLQISKGSVSQGLRALEELGAVEKNTDGRTGQYTARMELRTLVSGFVKSRLIPRLAASSQRLDDIRSNLDAMTPAEAQEAAWRLARVEQWHDRATQFLPLAEKVLHSASSLMPKRGS